MNKKLKIGSLLVALTALGAGLFYSIRPTLAQTYEGPSLYRGDFVTIHNTTEDNPPGGWADSIEADPGNIVEVRVEVRNEGQMTADHVQVIGHVPEDLSPTHTFSATIQAPYGGGTQITDTATVTLRDGSSQTFRYEPGHATIYGVTNLYNCPSGCSLSDNIASTGLEIGDVGPGQTVQVAFKARMTNLITTTPTPTPTAALTPTPTPTVTPTPTPTGSPTPTPTVTPTPTPTVTVTPTPGQGQTSILECPSGYVETVSGNTIICLQQITNVNNTNNNTFNPTINNNPTQTQTQTVTTSNPVVTGSTGSSVTTLPKTGLPIAAWGMGSLLPLGVGIKKFGLKSKGLASTANYLWQKREFLKES